jgi:hypothetical protein
VFAGVVDFLFDERADLVGELRRGAFAERLDRIDEQGLAARESGRQRIEPGRRHGIAVEPPAVMDLAPAEAPVAHDDPRRLAAGHCRTYVETCRGVHAGRLELTDTDVN